MDQQGQHLWRRAAAAVRLQATYRGHLVREDVKHALLAFNGAHAARMRLNLLHARGINWAEWQMGRRQAQRRQRERDAATPHSSSLVHALPSPLTTYSLAAPSVHAGCNGSHLAVGAPGVMNGGEDRDRRANFPSRALSVKHPTQAQRYAEELRGQRARQDAELLVLQAEAEAAQSEAERRRREAELAAVLRQQERSSRREEEQRAAARPTRAAPLYARRPPGGHSHHARGGSESDESESESESESEGGGDSEGGAVSSGEAAALAKAEAEADEQIYVSLDRLDELKCAMARHLLICAGWSSEQIDRLGDEVLRTDELAPWHQPLLAASFYTEHGGRDVPDVDAAGFYWAADGSFDPFWWSGSGSRLAGTSATLGATGLHFGEVAPQSRAQMGELRTAWAQAARADADASMSRGTAMRAARRAAEAETAAEAAEAAEEAAAEEEELLLGCI